MTHWSEIDPKNATGIDVTKRDDIVGPKNELGEECPWPWEPQQLVGAPMGQYHCPYCGAMVMAGVPHLDYPGPASIMPQEEIDKLLAIAREHDQEVVGIVVLHGAPDRGLALSSWTSFEGDDAVEQLYEVVQHAFEARDIRGGT